MNRNLLLCTVIATAGSLLASSTLTDQQEPPPARFMYPTTQEYRLDACLNSRSECGQPAANAFCHDHGYAKAVDWRIDDHVAPTMTLRTGLVCNEECKGFVYIVCDGHLEFY